MRKHPWVGSSIAAALLSVAVGAAALEDLHEYAAECDAQIGVSVPAFHCEDGTPIPGQHTYVESTQTYLGVEESSGNGPCDNPQAFNFNSTCQPGSRFQVLQSDTDTFVVALCRTDGKAIVPTPRETSSTIE